MVRIILVLLLMVATAACRMPDGPPVENIPTGERIGNNSITGSVVRFRDGDVVCYATRDGISCLYVR